MSEMNKILIIGCPGSGKSTFARRLRDITGLPLHYLDMIWHKPDKTNISREEFDAALREIISGDRWIIDGNYQRTLEMRVAACDSVFLFDLPTDICLEGARSRIGKKREEMPWIATELDIEFEQCITDFADHKLPAIYDLLRKYDIKNVTVFKSREAADAYLDGLSYPS